MRGVIYLVIYLIWPHQTSFEVETSDEVDVVLISGYQSIIEVHLCIPKSFKFILEATEAMLFHCFLAQPIPPIHYYASIYHNSQWA